jgi:hypothetical protein
MEAHEQTIQATQQPPPTNSLSPKDGEFTALFELAVQTCEALIAAYSALDQAYQAIDDFRMAFEASPCKALEITGHQTIKTPRASTLLLELIPIPRLLPANTLPVDSTPASSTFSPIPKYSHILIVITDYEPRAQACWDIGFVNEFRAAMRGGGKEAKDVGLWRGWTRGGSVVGLDCLGDGEDRGAFASAADEDGDEEEEDEGNGKGEEDEEAESSSDYGSDTDTNSDEYDSDGDDEDCDEYDSDSDDSDDSDDYDDDIGINIVFG